MSTASGVEYYSGSLDSGSSNLTVGFSVSGMEAYKDELRLHMLEEAKQQLSDYDLMKQELIRAWQGQARDRFIEEFDRSVEDVKNALDVEFKDLEQRLDDIKAFYLNQDANMMNKQ